MSLFSKIFKSVGSLVKTAAPIAAVIPSPIQPIAAVIAGAQVAKSALPSLPGAGPTAGIGGTFGAPPVPQIMSGILPALPALGSVAGSVGRALGSAVVPAVVGGARVAIGAGRGLAVAAARWCQRNPKTCAALGGASIVADMMRSGEIKRPGRRMNPLNVKAARRAIRRIKGVRKICNDIERSLPMRRARGGFGSPGVITRREAARALRR